ncbi:MAG TPA: hypothetical protein PKA17_03180, partial [Phenylobacterium sp.]|nr:hypothetical protein [Phenylobacterium sp.]
SAFYKIDPWSFNLTARGGSDGGISNAYTECQSVCPTLTAPYYTINDNHIDGALYFDVSATYGFDLGDSGASGAAYI